MQNHEVIIIGAGPAGISAAIQLKRFGVKPLIIEKNEVGGLLKNANLVENYLGFPDGISGVELIKLFHKQLENNQIDICTDTVINVEFKNNLFEIATSTTILKSKILIIASGTNPRTLNLETTSKKIFYEVSSISNIKDKTVAIIGAGDAAFDYGLNLSTNNKVIILNKSERIKCIKALLDKCKEKQSIEYLSNIQIKQAQKQLNGLSLICEHGNITKEIFADYLLVAIGREPNLDFVNYNFNSQMNKLVESKHLYIAGDVKNKTYRQTSISTGDGIRAAMEIFEKLTQEKSAQ